MLCGGFGGYGFSSADPLSYTWMFLAMGFRLLVFIGLVVLAVKLFKSYTNKSEDNMRILNERFAKGEISEEEYMRRKTILSQKN